MLRRSFLAAVTTSALARGAGLAGCGVAIARHPVAPESVGLKPEPIRNLVRLARDADSTGLALFKNGVYIAGFGDNDVADIGGITKVVVNMAVGRLFAEGAWTQLDTPLHRLLPEFAGDPKANVTLRHLLSGTSGIRDVTELRAWDRAQDWVAAARAQTLASAPGTRYEDSTAGPALLAAAVERFTGSRLDQFAKTTLFDPLCIKHHAWAKDQAGHAAGYTGLQLPALAVAKLGQLMLNRGVWDGVEILKRDWVERSVYEGGSLAPESGYLWKLEWSEAYPLPVRAFQEGAGGQHLVVFPNHGVVAARVRKGSDAKGKQLLGSFSRMVAEALIRQQS
jgi:CubicO group peptidase (beta-lactamase class C family)